MNTWIISDSHFNHSKIIPFCGRPFDSVEEMNEVMTRRWNNKVSDGDLVIHLGDFILSWNVNNMRKIRERLKGTILLILGNHDNRRRVEQCDVSVAGSYVIKVNNLLLTHKPLRDIHDSNSVNVHGHIHNIRRTYGRRINASVEVTNYEPVDIKRYFALADRILERENGQASDY